MVVGYDIKGTEKPGGPAIVQIPIEDDGVPVNYVIQLRSGLTSTSPTNVFGEGFPKGLGLGAIVDGYHQPQSKVVSVCRI